MQTVIYVEWINKILLWQLEGNYIQYPIIDHNGKNVKKCVDNHHL